MEKEFIVVLELGFLAFNIRKEVYGVLEKKIHFSEKI
jgi:hypothetical protein